MSQYAFYIGRKTNNDTVKADGWHHRSDALSSVVVLIGILFAKKFWWIDSALGAIISVMLFYATFKIAKDTINKLLGEKPNPELTKKITALIETEGGSKIHPHHFHIHNYISHQELTFHIKVHRKMMIAEAHELATKIEKIVFNEFNIVATIHIEPEGVEHEED